MSTCPSCGRTNPEGSGFCIGCGQRLSREPRAAEAEHIRFLIEEIPAWVRRGWVSSGTAHFMTREYSLRREALLNPTAAFTSGPGAAVRLPAAHAAAAPSAPASRSAARPGPTAPATEAPGAVSPPSNHWLGEFLEAHWLKLLAAVAALLIFVGMRQILGWTWVGTLALTLIPVLPLGLSCTFYYFGIRARERQAVGAFAYCSVAIVLAAFAVFSVNKHWLHEAIAQPMATALGLGASTLLAAITLSRTRDLGFLHVLLAGIASTLYAALQVFWPSPVFLPAPLLVYGTAFELLALALLAAGFVVRGRVDNREISEAARFALLVWAHLCTVAVLARAALPSLGGGIAPEATTLAAAAAAVYLLGAQWFGSVSMGYSGGALAAVTTALMFQRNTTPHWYAYAMAALVYSVCALGLGELYRWRAGSGADRGGFAGLAGAYSRLSFAAAALAGGFVAARALLSLAGPDAPLWMEWREGVTVSALCAAFYGLLAVRLRQAGILYAFCAASCYSLTLAANRLLSELGILHPHTLAHDLLPFTVLALGLGLALPARQSQEPHEAREAAEKRATDWHWPMLHCAAAGCAAGLALAIWHGVQAGPSSGMWAALLPYGLLSIAGAMGTRRHDAMFAQGWLVGALAAGGAASAFAAMQIRPGAPWNDALAAGLALSLLGWLYYALARSVGGTRPWWYAPVLWSSTAAALLAALLTAGANDASLFMFTIGFASSFLLLLFSAAETGDSGLAASAAVFGFAALRFEQVVVDGPAARLALTLFALGAAAAYGVAGWRRDRQACAWLGAAALAAAGIAASGYDSESRGYSWLAAACSGGGMLAGAAALGLAAARWRRPDYSYAAGLFGVWAYIRLVTLAFHVDPAWAGLVIMPASALLVLAGRLLEQDDHSLFRQPLERSALLAGYVGVGVSLATTVSSGHLPAVVVLLCWAVALALAALDAPERSMVTATVSVVFLAGAWALAFNDPAGAPQRLQFWMLLAGSSVCSAAYGRFALSAGESHIGVASAAAAAAGWLAVTYGLLRIEPLWLPLAFLPFLVVLYTLGHGLRSSEDARLASPCRHTAVVLSVGAVAASVVQGLRWTQWTLWTHGTVWTVTGTIAAYGAAYLAGTCLRRTPEWAALSASTLTLAYGYHAGMMGITAPHWACWMAGAGAFWLAVARALQSRERLAPISNPVYWVSAMVSGLAAVVALLNAGEPHEGMWAILALAISGSVFTGHFMAGLSESFAHTGFASFFGAYALIMYDRFHLDAGVLDLYLIPVGLYLLLLGHLSGRRGRYDSAGALWWMGLLTVLTPTFAAFYTHYTEGGTPLHALLLLVECLVAMGWGIAQRIKSFVFAGAFFSLAFAMTLARSTVVEIWSGLFAVGLGVIMLTFVFYVSVHQEAIRRWITRVGAEWRQWR